MVVDMRAHLRKFRLRGQIYAIPSPASIRRRTRCLRERSDRQRSPLIKKDKSRSILDHGYV